MTNLRAYGSPPFRVAAVHGGPGAPGDLAPVARELSTAGGVLEPLQTATSLEGQVRELRHALETHGEPPLTVIGHSWGAMLGFILAARHPQLVAKLILVGSGPFEERYAAGITATRLARLGQEERREALALKAALEDASASDKSASFARLGRLIAKADAFDPLTLDSEALECQYDVNQRVWRDAQQLRATGALLRLGEQIRCPVVAVHGDYDPHPAEGVREPLASALPDFRFVLLEHCGHQPWVERRARDRFYAVLREEIG